MRKLERKDLDDLLKQSAESDKMSPTEEALIELVKMNRIQKTKNIHNHPVYYSDKSGWTTYVDDPTMRSGKRSYRRTTEESLWEALSEWYIDNEGQNKVTLKEIYPKWLEQKKTPTNEENIRRIEASWKAYYINEPLSKDLIDKPLKQITPLMLREWSESLLKKHYPVDLKKFSRMFSIINGCMDYAADEDIHIIQENIWTKAKKKINRGLMETKPLASDEEQVFTDEQKEEIWQMVYEDLTLYDGSHPTSAGLQILFMFETGLRIGECCGLKWSDIKNGRLYVRRQANNRGVREWTKSEAGYRDIPLTKEALRVLKDVKAYNKKHGLNASQGWVFQGNNPKYDYRLSYQAADHKLRRLCDRLDTPEKSPHKLRKTCISTLLDNAEVNERTVQRFAGHKDSSTTHRYYSYERKTKDQQSMAIENALSHSEAIKKIQRFSSANK